MNARDVTSVMTVYSPDAVTIYDGNVRRGTAEIKTAAEKAVADEPQSVTTWSTTSGSRSQRLVTWRSRPARSTWIPTVPKAKNPPRRARS